MTGMVIASYTFQSKACVSVAVDEATGDRIEYNAGILLASLTATEPEQRAAFLALADAQHMRQFPAAEHLTELDGVIGPFEA
jgi:hypothetical protein